MIPGSVVASPATAHAVPGYGLWTVALLNVLVFGVFAYSFFLPRTQHDWRAFGAFVAFLVALFAEMYGFPLTVYFLAGWLAGRVPGFDPRTHDGGHLWNVLLGWRGDPHLSPPHMVSFALIGGGLWLLARAWPVLYAAQRAGAVATTGPYALVRHPQYAAFLLIMLGFLVQWPTIPTLVLFPILAVVYARLARREEREALTHRDRAFAEAYAAYAARTPAFLPRLAPTSRSVLRHG